jgi:cytoskeletal protein RodZ
MTSTKSFSTKNATILIVAVFSLAISIGLSQISSALAQTNMVNCSTEVDDESNDSEVNNARSCDDEAETEDESNESNSSQASSISSSTSSSNNDDDEDEQSERNDNVTTKPQNVVSSGPASASPEDNIIKPINLNKGLVSDKPLKTNNMNNMNNNNNHDEEIDAIKVIEDEFEFKKQMDKTSDVSEIYKSFDLPYTALYKNP